MYMGHTADSGYPDQEKVDKKHTYGQKACRKMAGRASKDSTLKSSNAVNAKLAISLYFWERTKCLFLMFTKVLQEQSPTWME